LDLSTPIFISFFIPLSIQAGLANGANQLAAMGTLSAARSQDPGDSFGCHRLAAIA